MFFPREGLECLGWAASTPYISDKMHSTAKKCPGEPREGGLVLLTVSEDSAWGCVALRVCLDDCIVGWRRYSMSWGAGSREGKGSEPGSRRNTFYSLNLHGTSGNPIIARPARDLWSVWSHIFVKWLSPRRGLGRWEAKAFCLSTPLLTTSFFPAQGWASP